MSHRSRESGFTLAETMIVILLIGLVSSLIFSIFSSTFLGYLKLQSQASTVGQLSFQSNRVTNVLRSTIGIESANDNDLTVFAYFYPSDAYASKVHYYVKDNGDKKMLLADLTPMDGNPPTGVPDLTKKKTLQIVDDLYLPTGTKLFTYLNAGNSPISTPVPSTDTIKSIRLNLGASLDKKNSQNLDVQIVIRNRKSNL